MEDKIAVTYGAEIEEDRVEAEGEVKRLLTVTGQRQGGNYHLWKVRLLGVGREIQQSIIKLVCLPEAVKP